MTIIINDLIYWFVIVTRYFGKCLLSCSEDQYHEKVVIVFNYCTITSIYGQKVTKLL
jgi:hypothetical protein